MRICICASLCHFEALRASSSPDDRLAVILKTPAMLCPLSLWGIYDPPRASVPGSIEKCRKAGIQVKMITGDQQATAAAIGQQIGILDDQCREDCTMLCEQLHENHGRRSVKERRISRRASEILRQTEDLEVGGKKESDSECVRVICKNKHKKKPSNSTIGKWHFL